MDSLEIELITDLLSDLCERLSTDDLLRLDQKFTLTRYRQIRRLYEGAINIIDIDTNSNKPLNRINLRIELRQWLQNNPLERQIYETLDRIADAANLLSGKSTLEPTDHDGLIVDLVITEVLAEIKLFTGIDDPLDPITVACCEVVLRTFSLPTDGMDPKLQRLSRERNQPHRNNQIIEATAEHLNATTSFSEIVAKVLEEHKPPMPDDEHLRTSIVNVLHQRQQAEGLRVRSSG